MPLSQVLDLLGFTASTRRGPQVRGRCPVHSSTTPKSRSFAAHLEKNCWRCFGCGAGGNALDLYVAATQLPLYEAALELSTRLHLSVPWKGGRGKAWTLYSGNPQPQTQTRHANRPP